MVKSRWKAVLLHTPSAYTGRSVSVPFERFSRSINAGSFLLRVCLNIGHKHRKGVKRVKKRRIEAIWMKASLEEGSPS
jgi:hypothetical protein